MSRYFVGQRVTVTGTFVDEDGAAFDPVGLEFRVKRPDLTTVTYDQDSVAVTNPVVGTWVLDYVVAADGWHTVVIESTVSPQEAVQQLRFEAVDPQG